MSGDTTGVHGYVSYKSVRVHVIVGKSRGVTGVISYQLSPVPHWLC